MTNTNKVGYRNPPIKTRFKVGKSGNPTGRPKGSGEHSLAAALRHELGRPIQITENGRTIKVPVSTAVAKSMINSAIKGDYKYAQMIMEHDANGAQSNEQSAQNVAKEDKQILGDYVQRAKTTGNKDRKE